MNELTWLFAALLVGIAVGWLARAIALPNAKRKTEAEAAAPLSADSLLLSVNHDLRQRLQGLGLFVTALKSRPLPDDLARLAARIEASYTSFTDEFGALIDLVRLQDGRLKLTAGEFSLQDLWRRLDDECQPLTEARGQLLRFHQGKATVLHGDMVLLQKILRPLIGAALAASDEGGMVLVGARRRPGKWRIDIWHGAPGFDAAGLAALLAPADYPQADHMPKPSLALRLAHRLCPLIGARLGNRQTEGKGGVLWLELSQTPPEEARR